MALLRPIQLSRCVPFLMVICALTVPSVSYAQHDLTVKVAIIYELGGPQPVGHTRFRLLDGNAENMLANTYGLQKKEENSPRDTTSQANSGQMAAIEPMDPIDPRDSGPDAFAKYAQACYDKNKLCGKGWETLYNHTVQFAKTDLDGTLVFEDLPSGQYYIYGYATTRGGEWIFWNHRVRVNKDTSVELSQSNAAYIAN